MFLPCRWYVQQVFFGSSHATCCSEGICGGPSLDFLTTKSLRLVKSFLWDLQTVLYSLVGSSFEPLDQVDLEVLSQAELLFAMALANKASDLCASLQVGGRPNLTFRPKVIRAFFPLPLPLTLRKGEERRSVFTLHARALHGVHSSVQEDQLAVCLPQWSEWTQRSPLC